MLAGEFGPYNAATGKYPLGRKTSDQPLQDLHRFRSRDVPGIDDNGGMMKTLQAVYGNGVLRPLEALSLKEHQRVTVTLSDSAERWLDHEYMDRVRKAVATMGPAPSLEEVRQSLSKIPGNLSDDIRAERERR